MKVIIAAFLLWMLWSTPGTNTTIALKTRLTAKNGDAIPGCNVVLKGTSIPTAITQECGEFEIEVPADDKGVLVFSCLAPRRDLV